MKLKQIEVLSGRFESHNKMLFQSPMPTQILLPFARDTAGIPDFRAAPVLRRTHRMLILPALKCPRLTMPSACNTTVEKWVSVHYPELSSLAISAKRFRNRSLDFLRSHGKLVCEYPLAAWSAAASSFFFFSRGIKGLVKHWGASSLATW